MLSIFEEKIVKSSKKMVCGSPGYTLVMQNINISFGVILYAKMLVVM